MNWPIELPFDDLDCLVELPFDDLVFLVTLFAVLTVLGDEYVLFVIHPLLLNVYVLRDPLFLLFVEVDCVTPPPNFTVLVLVV